MKAVTTKKAITKKTIMTGALLSCFAFSSVALVQSGAILGEKNVSAKGSLSESAQLNDRIKNDGAQNAYSTPSGFVSLRAHLSRDVEEFIRRSKLESK